MKIHLYGQWTSHEDAYVVADLEGLTALRDACNAAILRGSSVLEGVPQDGESFALFVINLEKLDPKWEQLRLPYPLPGREEYVDGIHPGDLLSTHRYRELRARIDPSE